MAYRLHAKVDLYALHSFVQYEHFVPDMLPMYVNIKKHDAGSIVFLKNRLAVAN